MLALAELLCPTRGRSPPGTPPTFPRLGCVSSPPFYG